MQRVGPDSGARHKPSDPVLDDEPIREPFFHKDPQGPVDADPIEAPARWVSDKLPVRDRLLGPEERFEHPGPRCRGSDPGPSQQALRIESLGSFHSLAARNRTPPPAGDFSALEEFRSTLSVSWHKCNIVARRSTAPSRALDRFLDFGQPPGERPIATMEPRKIRGPGHG